jgi:Protein of unknown function (DUF3047)
VNEQSSPYLPRIGPAMVQVVVPGDRPPWTPTGMWVRRGERVTLLGAGRIRWSAACHGGPKYHLWGRVPGGEIFGCTQDTTTVVVDHTGPLELCVYLGVWADSTGTLATGEGPYRKERGALEVTVLRWPPGTDPVDGLAALEPGTAEPRLVAAERARLLDPVVPPAGWSYLRDIGPADIYRHAVLDGRPAVDVVCDDDAGILVNEVDVALQPDTELAWSWRVDQLPGTEPEDTPFTHDYLSIATVFDTGRDLTWLWSAALPPEQAFACPIRGWSDRETHLPIRSGTAGLGSWRREVRNVWADHERFLGPPPARITAVWLIAVSHFGHGCGRATFTDIALHSGGEQVAVL